MPFNAAGLNSPYDVDTLSLHHTNPGIGASPAANTELTDAPYARQAAVFNAPVAGEAILNADVPFSLHLSIDQNVQFVGLWKGAVYKGYQAPATPNNFTGTATTRTFTVKATTTKLTVTNPA